MRSIPAQIRDQRRSKLARKSKEPLTAAEVRDEKFEANTQNLLQKGRPFISRRITGDLFPVPYFSGFCVNEALSG